MKHLYPSQLSSLFSVFFICYHLFFVPDILQAQDYYYENTHLMEGFGYYSDAHGKAIVPDGQGNYLSYFDGCSGCGGATVMKLDSNANVLWSKGFSTGSGNSLTISSLLVDAQGNIYLYGYYSGNFDTDPGSGTYILSNSSSYFDYFMIKLDNNGDFLLARRLTSSASSVSGAFRAEVAMDVTNNSYVVFLLRGTYDVDPDTSVYNLTSLRSSVAIQKLDNQGNLIWAKNLPSTSSLSSYSGVHQVEIDNDSNLYIIGRFSDSIDFDPDPLVNHYIYSPSEANFILKLDNNGVFQWVQILDYGGFQSTINDVVLDPMGDIYIAGSFEDTIDAHPGATNVSLISQGNEDFYLLKLNKNGGFVWAHSAGGQYEDTGEGIFYQNGKIFYVGKAIGRGDIALGPVVDSIPNMAALGYANFLQVIDTAGGYLANYAMPGLAFPRKIRVTDEETVYITGAYSSIDFDPSAGVAYFDDGPGGVDYYFLKLSRDSCKAFDFTTNNTQNFICQDTAIASITPNYGLTPYQYIWNTGETDSLLYYDSATVFTVTVTDARGCVKEKNIYFEGPKDSLGTGVDVEPYLQGAYARLRPGQIRTFTLTGVNHYCTPTDGYLYIVLDSSTSYLSSIATPPDSIIGDTLFWNFTTLRYDNALEPSFRIQVDSFIVFGRGISYEVGMHSVIAELDSSNNIKHYQGLIVNSYDPNRKLAYPEGECASKFVEKKEKLSYTIEFQNTGTAYAYDIKIVDTLSTDLDLYSLDVVGASHRYRVEINDNNILIFYFDRIFLPDSVRNEPASHGYITFDINLKPNLLGDISVENKVGIYFDLNPPIITNTVLRTYTDSLPQLNNSISLLNNSLVAQQNNAIYQWVDCDNNNAFLIGETGQSFSPTQNGSYAVWVESATCTVLSPCFDYLFLDNTTIQQQSTIKVFPNPASANLYIRQATHLVPFYFKIYDSWGRVVLEKKATTGALDINISKLPTGVYHLVYFNDQESGSTKFLKID